MGIFGGALMVIGGGLMMGELAYRIARRIPRRDK